MIYLVRHAHADYSPDEMRGLSASGRAAATRLADILEEGGIARIHSSPYRRAIETVQPLADRLQLPIQVEHDLRERRLSTGPVDDFQRWLEASWRDFDLAYPGGESSRTAQARVSRAIHRIAAAEGRNVAIASHGNALALFLRTLDASVDFAFWARMSMPDVYVVDGADATTWSYRRLWPAGTVSSASAYFQESQA